MKFLVINGVNLNMTGRREEGVYGSESLDDINRQIAARSSSIRATSKGNCAVKYNPASTGSTTASY